MSCCSLRRCAFRYGPGVGARDGVLGNRTVGAVSSGPRLAFAPVPVKPQTVSILDDPTLRRGDAVMTAKGMRIFVGSTTGPHTNEDFVDLAKSGREVSKATGKVLADLDRRPGG